MKFSSLMKKVLPASVIGAVLAVPAYASTAALEDTADAFQSYYATIDGWVKGPLGVGIATTMLLMGAGIGIAKNSPMPALSGVAGGAFLHWGPGIIKQMITQGMLF